MNVSELQNLLYTARARRVTATLTLSDVANATQAMDGVARDQLVEHIRARRETAAGRLLVAAVREYVTAQAKSYVDDLLADGTLTLTELQDI